MSNYRETAQIAVLAYFDQYGTEIFSLGPYDYVMLISTKIMWC